VTGPAPQAGPFGRFRSSLDLIRRRLDLADLPVKKPPAPSVRRGVGGKKKAG
jgi:hypothetical protein